MNFIKQTLIISCVLLLSACNPKKPYEGPIGPEVPPQEPIHVDDRPKTIKVWEDVYEPDTLEADSHLEKIVANLGPIKFKCPEGGCHPSVPMIYNRRAGRCEGVLISPNEVLTAEHCIQPDDGSFVGKKYFYLSNINESCKKIAVFFPGTDEFKQEEVGCKSVRGSQEGDFAIITLQRDIARPLGVLNPNSSSTKKKLISINRNEAGEFEESLVSCDQIPAYSPYGWTNTNLAMDHCEVMTGNSGGPVLNEDGSVWGIISRTEGPGSDFEIHMMANAGCIKKFIEDPLNFYKECGNRVDPVDRNIREQIPDLPEKKEDERYYGDYRVFTDFTIVPKCLPDLKGKIQTEMTDSTYCHVTQKKLGTDQYIIKHCSEGTIRFSIYVELNGMYRGTLWARSKERFQGYFSTPIIIPKCEAAP